LRRSVARVIDEHHTTSEGCTDGMGSVIIAQPVDELAVTGRRTLNLW
jgi:hypothetical protein